MFDSACQGSVDQYGIGAIFLLSRYCFFKLKMGGDGGTINREEILDIWSLLKSTSLNHVDYLQVARDSKCIIDWTCRRNSLSFLNQWIDEQGKNIEGNFLRP